MPTYTLRLAQVIEFTGGTIELTDMSFKGVDMGRISKLVNGNIGIEHMPIFDDDYRDILTGKIIDRYWNREIAFETIDLFQMKLRTHLNEIMPYYNQLYKSTLEEYEAFSTVNLKTISNNETETNEVANSSATGKGETKAESRSVNSSTPQTMLSGDEDYATSAVDSNSENNSNTENSSEANSSTEGKAKGDTIVQGYQGSPADLISRFRDSLINPDLMVLNAMEPMFMQTFDNADSYTERGFGRYGYYY